jgi:two-component system response regulator CpxR
MAAQLKSLALNGLPSAGISAPQTHRMANTSILLVDDDHEMCEMLVEYLQRSSFDVLAEHDGLAALGRVEKAPFDLIILDVMLPSLDGFEVLKTIRKSLATPVIMLTARGEDVDSILGLELGADDYLSKPFNPRHLVARIRAVLRRSERASDIAGKILTAGELALNTTTLSAVVRGKTLELTGTEFRLLESLMEPVGRTQSREFLAERVLGRSYSAFDRSIDTHISNLRKKLSIAGASATEIRSIRGSGYVLIREADGER